MPVLLLALMPVAPRRTAESAYVDEAQQQINVDVLRAVFDLVFAPLQQVTQEGTVIDCSDRQTGLCFWIVLPSIADPAEHATLHRIGSTSCPRCLVQYKVFGENPQKIYEVDDVTGYRVTGLGYWP